MRVLVLALGIALLHFSQPILAQKKSAERVATSWQTFQFAPGRYEVAFPAAPVMQQGKLRSAVGEIVSTRHTADSAGATYDVTYNDYPDGGIARLSAETLLDTVRDGLVYQSKGSLMSEKRLMKSTVRELEIAGEDGTRYRIRLLLRGNRMYQLTAMGKPPARVDALKFFNSFKTTVGSPP